MGYRYMDGPKYIMYGVSMSRSDAEIAAEAKALGERFEAAQNALSAAMDDAQDFTRIHSSDSMYEKYDGMLRNDFDYNQIYVEVGRVLAALGTVYVNYDKDVDNAHKFRVDHTSGTKGYGAIAEYGLPVWHPDGDTLKKLYERHEMIAESIKEPALREAFEKFMAFMIEKREAIDYKEPSVFFAPRDLYISHFRGLRAVRNVAEIRKNRYGWGLAICGTDGYSIDTVTLDGSLIAQIRPELETLLEMRAAQAERSKQAVKDIHEKANELFTPWLSLMAL